MSTFHLQIVTPDGSFYDGEAERVRVRAVDGDVAILPGHIPYMTALGIGAGAVTVEGKARPAAVNGGMLAVTGSDVRIVATTFEWGDEIDTDRARAAKEKAEALLKTDLSDADRILADARLRRAAARLKAAGIE